MAKFSCFLLASAVLSSSFEMVDSIFQQLQNSTFRHGMVSSAGVERETLTWDVFAIMTSVEQYHPSVRLKIIYDLNYEDSLSLELLTKAISNMRTGISVFHYESLSLTKKSPVLYPAVGKSLVIVLCSPTNVVNMFSSIRNQRLKSHQAKWLFVLKDSGANEVLRKLEALIFEGTYVGSLLRQSPGVYRSFSSRISDEGKITFYSNGQWNLNVKGEGRDTLKYITASPDGHLYKDMRGRKLVITAIKCSPFFGLVDVEGGGVRSTYGVDVMILESLASTLNFTFHLVTPKDGSWGLPQPDGSASGMIGMVVRKEADVALSVIGVNDVRAQVIDYTNYYYLGSLAIFSRAPKEKNRALAVLTPFTLEVWLYIIASTILMGPVLYAQSKVSSHYLKENPTSSLQSLSFNMFRNCVLQGNLIETGHWPQRLIFFFWYLFCLVISALYSGMLIAVLAIPAYETPINSLEELPDAVKRGYTLGVTKDSTHEVIFREAKEGIYKEIWDLFNHKDRSQSFVDNIAVGVSRVLERKFVLIGPPRMMEFQSMRLGREKFHLSRQSFFPQTVAIACPQGAPYRDSFSLVLWRLVEGGFILRWFDDELRRFQKRTADAKEGPAVISLTHLQAAFFIMSIGFMTSGVSLLLENLLCQSRVSKIES